MKDIDRLLAIEEIKRLKSRYFYYLDHKDWARWKSEVWAPDAAPLGYTLLHGFGHYHETYIRRPEGWRIKTTRLTRLHLERT
jgi:hypothetical protein